MKEVLSTTLIERSGESANIKQNSDNDKRWIHFKNGNLKGLYLYTTDNYAKNYIDGNTDQEMMSSIVGNNASGKIIFDVGAFIGASSLVFSKLVGEKGRVVAFEPNPYNLRRIEKNLQKNISYGKNVVVFPIALSDNNNKTKMLLSKEIDNGYSSTSRLEGSHSTIRNLDLPEGFEDVEVEVKTLDTFVAEENILPDILKIDIEGAEYDFLLGAAETIKKIHPTFYIELHSQYCAAKCTEFLVLEGYSIKVLHEEEDNRVMILAEYTNDSKAGVNIEMMKFQDASFSTIKNISDGLAVLNKDIQAKSRQILDLVEENKVLGAEKERADAAESINKILSERLENIESSRSWTITKPLRTAAHIIKAIKK